MRWLKKTAPALLMVTLAALVLATLVSDHTAEFGEVSLPQGGTVELPKGTTSVYVDDPSSTDSNHRLSGPLRFEVRPAAGGEPIPEQPTAKYGTSEFETQRSQDFGESLSVAELEAPVAGSYVVTGVFDQNRQMATLSFGRDSFAAVAARWKLWAALLGAALLIWLLPEPRKRRRSAEEPTLGPVAGPEV